MHDVIDLERYPLDRPGSGPWGALVRHCTEALQRDGLFNLPGFLRPGAGLHFLDVVAERKPRVRQRRHLRQTLRSSPPALERGFDLRAVVEGVPDVLIWRSGLGE